VGDGYLRKDREIYELEMIEGTDATAERTQKSEIDYKRCKLKIMVKQLDKIYSEKSNSFANWDNSEIPWDMNLY